MKKKLLSVILCVPLLYGCAVKKEIVAINIQNPEIENNAELGIDALVEIGSHLYYDRITNIVYFWNGFPFTSRCAVTPSPYYAPNGLPYKYNPETNNLEEIKGE